ncbi:MAG: dTMP kinase [Nitrospirota bacterium]
MKRKGGLFISFEGIEGTGKSTQARLLRDWLEAQGMEAVLTREPGGTGIGKKIRQVLLDANHGGMDPLTELLLYAADRRQHMTEEILPSTGKGLVVITDRFSDSTRAYQGRARGIGPRVLEKIDKLATGGLKPDLTILLDMDVFEGLSRNRSANKSDRLELEEISFHEKVRKAFLDIQRAEPERVKLVDATGTVEEVHGRVVKVVREFLEGRQK